MDVDQILVVIVAAIVAFYIKGVTGIGGPLLAVPVLAIFTGVEFAVAVIAVPTFLSNTWLLISSRRTAHGVVWFLIPMLVAGMAGAALGSWALVSADNRALSLGLALLILIYVALNLANREFILGRKTARILAAPVGLIGGWLQGATGIAAPVFATYLHALGLPRRQFIFAITLPFWTNGLVQFISLGAFGGYDRERIIAGLVSAIPVMVVLPIGIRHGDKLSQRSFRSAILGILCLAAVALVYGAVQVPSK